jgi:hypothetical protein
MFEFLLYSSLSCVDADSIMIKIRANENLSKQVRVELVDTVQESTPNCYWPDWDAND